jgi:hypothetical protein
MYSLSDKMIEFRAKKRQGLAAEMDDLYGEGQK